MSGTGKFIAYDIGTNTWIHLPHDLGTVRETADAPVNMRVSDALHTADPVSGDLLVAVGHKFGGMYRYSVDQDVWTQHGRARCGRV